MTDDCCNGSLIEQGRYRECECCARESRAALGLSDSDPIEKWLPRAAAIFLLVFLLVFTADRWFPIALEFFL